MKPGQIKYIRVRDWQTRCVTWYSTRWNDDDQLKQWTSLFFDIYVGLFVELYKYCEYCSIEVEIILMLVIAGVCFVMESI